MGIRLPLSEGFNRKNKPFLKCQIGRAIDLNPCIKREKAEF